MYWLETKYALLLSSRLSGFKKRNDVYNFRCPLCLDSEKSKRKARGYIISRHGSGWFFCHNCGASMSFGEFLEGQDRELHSQYTLDKITEKNSFKSQTVEAKNTQDIIDTDNILSKLKKVSQLPLTHPVRKYIANRKIPSRSHYKVYFCPKFKSWVNSIIPNKFEDTTKDEPRLIFAMFDENKKLFGINARTLTGSEPKYITIKFDESRPKVFGLDSIDKSRDVWVFEGPIDSLMVSNAVATCGGVLMSEIKNLDIPKENFVLVFDNEPRKKETVAHIDKAIKAGYRVVLLREGLTKKDANATICEGMTPLEFKNLLKKYTFQGLEAELEFANWRKC